MTTLVLFNFEWILYILADKKDKYIKAWMSLNFINIPSPIMELAPLEPLKR